MTQRKRATGFALMDTAFAADAKFVRLARKASNPTEFAAAVGVFWLMLADARRARSAIVHWEDYTEYAEQIDALKDAKLLTTNGFIDETFDNWAPAYKAPPERTRAYPTVPDGTPPYPSVSSNGQTLSTERTQPYPDVTPVRSGTESTVTSPHISSSQDQKVSSEKAENFMGFRPKEPGVWGGAGTHDGRHGESCQVCAPLRATPSQSEVPTHAR
jgi:hypothetical protein